MTTKRPYALLKHASCLFLFCLAFAPFLASCGGSSSSQQTTLVVWSNMTSSLTQKGAAGDYARYIVSQFQKEHPGVTVKFEDHGWDETLRQNLTTAILGGTAPDVTVGEAFFRQLAAQHALAPLDDVAADVKKDILPATYQASSYEGHAYTLSAYTGVFGFERNCKVITEAGLDCSKAPQTWNELLQQAKTITQKGNSQYYGYTLQGPAGFSIGSVLRLDVYLSQANASLCQNSCTQPWFNNPNAVPVYQFLRDINQQTPPGLTFNADEGSVYSQLYKNKSAYQIAGSWYVGWAKQNGCQDCRYSAVPVSAGGHQASVLVADIQYAALKQSKHLDLAKQFVKFLTRSDVQSRVYPSTGNLPTSISVLQKLRPTVDASTQQFIDTLLTANLQTLPQWTKNPQKVWSAYNDMLTKLLTTNTPIQQLMDQAQTQAEQASNG